MTIALLIVGATAVIVLCLWLGSMHARRRRMARFRDRKPMSPQVFYETFYAESGLPKEIVTRMLDDLEQSTGIPRTLLRPEDRLWEGESMDDLLYDSLHTVELVLDFEELERETGQHVEIGTLETVDQYIRTRGLLERQTMMNRRLRKQA